jgi:Ion channel
MASATSTEASPSSVAAEAAAANRAVTARYGVLLVTAVASLFVQGVVPPSDVQQVVVAALAGASLLLAFRAANLSGRLLAVAATAAAGAVVLSVVRATGGGVGEGATGLMNAVLVAFGPPAVAIGVIHEVRASGRVRVQAVMGVLALYLLLGMLFAFLYGAIDQLGGDPFFANGDAATTSRCLYFSFTTLTTVGYGDFVARSDLGHTLAVFEALLGQIYLVTVVSVLVSNLGRPGRPRSGDA